MDTVVRTAEEEFTIVLGEMESAGAVGIVAKALLELFATPYGSCKCGDFGCTIRCNIT
jgi:hypothetical protein